MAKLTKDQIKTAVNEQIAQADGYETGELQQLRQDALDYYYGSNRAAPQADGRSALQSSDVADMVEAVCAQMMPAFESDDLVEFEPLNDEDIDQAATETQAVSYVVMKQNNGFFEIQSAIKDALLLRNGIIKVWVDEKVDIQTDNYDMLTEDEAAELTTSPGRLDNLKDDDNGFTAVIEEHPDMKGFYNATIKSKITERAVKVRSIDPVNFSWRADWDSIYLKDCPFVSERSYVTRSDLIEMGYKKSLVNSIGADGGRDYYTTTRYQNGNSNRYAAAEPSQDEICMYECYIRLDANGDSVGELLKVVIANNVILESDETDFIPYASGTAFLQPHRFDGLGLYDKLYMLQDQKTQTTRQLADNQNHANNARVGAVANSVNMDDLTNSRPGGVVRITSPDALVPFPYTDIGPSCQSTLDYLDKVRAERGGASLDMVTAEAQIAGDTAHGVERQMTAKEMMAAMMTRVLADTLVKTTYEMVHMALRLYVTDPIQFRTHGQFSEVDPTKWGKRERVLVKAGLSNAERYRKKATLEAVMMRQDALIAAGMDEVLVSMDNMYNATVDWVKASGVNGAERYFIDPTSEEGQASYQQKLQGEQEAQQAAAAQQQELVALQKEIEGRKADNNDAKVIEDSKQAEEKLRFDYWKVQQEMEVKEAEMVTSTTLALVDKGGEDEQNEPSDTAA